MSISMPITCIMAGFTREKAVRVSVQIAADQAQEAGHLFFEAYQSMNGGTPPPGIYQWSEAMMPLTFTRKPTAESLKHLQIPFRIGPYLAVELHSVSSTKLNSKTE
jgi:hypothetical protein